MHEYSIVQSLIENCEIHARKNSSSEVTKVVVKIGVMSGVEPHLLEVAFETFKEASICKNAQFIIHMQAIKIKCHSCFKESELPKDLYCCPNCQSVDLDVIDGEDIYLMQLELA